MSKFQGKHHNISPRSAHLFPGSLHLLRLEERRLANSGAERVTLQEPQGDVGAMQMYTYLMVGKLHVAPNSPPLNSLEIFQENGKP